MIMEMSAITISKSKKNSKKFGTKSHLTPIVKVLFLIILQNMLLNKSYRMI